MHLNSVRIGTALCAALLALQTIWVPVEAVAAEPDTLSKVAQGARWLRICSSERRVDEATCNGFIMGLEETQFLTEFRPLYCPPPRFTVEEQKQIIVKYLKAHPARHNEAFARLAADAMREAYPCRN